MDIGQLRLQRNVLTSIVTEAKFCSKAPNSVLWCLQIAGEHSPLRKNVEGNSPFLCACKDELHHCMAQGEGLQGSTQGTLKPPPLRNSCNTKNCHQNCPKNTPSFEITYANSNVSNASEFERFRKVPPHNHRYPVISVCTCIWIHMYMHTYLYTRKIVDGESGV